MNALVTALAMLALAQKAEIKSEEDLVRHWSGVFQDFDDTLSSQEATVLAVRFVGKTRQWREREMQWRQDLIKELVGANRRLRDQAVRRKTANRIRSLKNDIKKLKRAKPAQWPLARITNLEAGKLGVFEWRWKVLQIVDGRNALVSSRHYGSELLWVTNINTKGMVDDREYHFDYIFRIPEDTKSFKTALGGTRTVLVAEALGEYERTEE